MVLSSNGNTDTLLTLTSLISHRAEACEIMPEKWPLILRSALSHGVGPYLWWELREAHIDAAILEPLKWAFWQNAARALRYELAQANVQAALADAHIPLLWLKGGALAHTVYPKSSLRPMADLDLLVPYERREFALEAVQGLGYDFVVPQSSIQPLNEDGIYQKLTHHYVLSSDGVLLELHYHLLRKDKVILSPQQMEWMWCQTETFAVGDNLYSTLKPEAHLLYLAAHAILQHGEYQSNLKQYLDLHLLIQRSPLDWNLVLQQAVTFKWTYAVERALTLAIQFFDTPVPKSILRKMKDFRPEDEEVLYAIHLRDKGERWERMRRTLAYLSFSEKIEYSQRVVFPSRAYMRQRYAIKEGRSVLPYYIYRWGDMAQAIVRWLLSSFLIRRKNRPRVRLATRLRTGFGFFKSEPPLEVEGNLEASKSCR